ncbi:MAG: hypothetical protein ACJZ3J_00415 [Candidatus Poseidoniales archaeon]|jgi:amino acid transporter|uniref:Uncharacterized protein n=1 Tax=Marine Group III euryarchaeote CG-Epi1 TaxID=1888995 RepID=A0A1J5TX98_9ARCH|nr:MAG: hypothetical protein BD935_04285 [Marine Group III euryarchaeote CG-Epi1]|tara:strand:- start:781 stop:1236 length:456 start_codon:yes stop_codon:yes gene_type:complete
MDMSTEIGDGVIMDYFVSMLLIGIGVALLATGLFTSYFGAGKSQKIGLGLLVTGILAIIITYILTFEAGTGVTTQFDDGVFMDALVSGISALAGMIIGMFVILFVLMKVDTVDDLEDLDLEDLEDLDLDEELKKLEKELNAESTDSSGEEE